MNERDEPRAPRWSQRDKTTPPADQPAAEHDTVPVEGLSRRDWFAGMALQGLLANGTIAKGKRSPPIHVWAEAAYEVADAMIEAGESDARRGSAEQG